MNIVSITDFEITKNKKITTKSPIVKRALQVMNKKRQFKYQNNEKVIDPFEFILACYDASQEKIKHSK